jgi:hypothetical protein
MSLELEPITDLIFEILEVTIVPDHTNFIDQEHGVRRNVEKAYIIVINEIAAV